MKRALVIRHIAHEGLDGFEEPIRAAGYAIDLVDPHSDAFDTADLIAPDLLVVLGGPMAAYDGDPWIRSEIVRLAARLHADKPTLGICLGSQMMAAALGARVCQGPAKEVGFSELVLTEVGRHSPLRHLENVPVLHWHGDTFDLPDGCERLASSALYQNQAFRRGPNLLALQFHAEVTRKTLDIWIARANGYIETAGTTPEAVRRDADLWSEPMTAAGRIMIAEWLAQQKGLESSN